VVVASFCFWGGGVPFPAFVVSSAMGVLPVFPVRSAHCKVPVRARSRSDKYAAVLRLHRTQPKDRRIYTALTGILAVCRTGKTGRTSMAEDTTKAGKGTGVVIGKNKGQIMHTKLSACQLNIFRDRMVSLFGN